jgi:hypothetical protein
MRTDEEILRLFAEANPRPPTLAPGAVQPPHIDTLEKREVTMTDTLPKIDRRPASPRRPRTVWPAVAVAAVVVVILTLLATGRDDGPTVADTTPPTTLARSEAIGVATEYFDARNAFDAAAVFALAAPGVQNLDGWDPGSLQLEFGWFEAFDWYLVEPHCTEEVTTDNTVVTCDYLVSNRLSRWLDLVDQTPGSVTLTLENNRIVELHDEWDWTIAYASQAFEPFMAWVAGTYPADVVTLWGTGTDEPVLSTARNQLFDERLTEYTAGSEPPLANTERYIAARSDGDPAAILGLLTDDATVADMWGVDRAGLPDLLRFFEATGWRWSTAGCPVSSIVATPEVTLECNYYVENVWTDAGLGDATPRTAIMKFTMSQEDGRIAAVQNSTSITHLETLLQPWFEWLDSNHPNDADVMYEVVDGIHVPQFTDEALALFATRTVEFADSQGE